MNEDCLKFRVWDEEKRKYHSGAFGLSPSGELLVEWVMGFRITKHPELKEEYDKLQNIEGRKI